VLYGGRGAVTACGCMRARASGPWWWWTVAAARWLRGIGGLRLSRPPGTDGRGRRQTGEGGDWRGDRFGRSARWGPRFRDCPCMHAASTSLESGLCMDGCVLHLHHHGRAWSSCCRASPKYTWYVPWRTMPMKKLKLARIVAGCLCYCWQMLKKRK
jgi:hypothetical protein